jgi:hypothetical protein
MATVTQPIQQRIPEAGFWSWQALVAAGLGRLLPAERLQELFSEWQAHTVNSSDTTSQYRPRIPDLGSGSDEVCRIAPTLVNYSFHLRYMVILGQEKAGTWHFVRLRVALCEAGSVPETPAGGVHLCTCLGIEHANHVSELTDKI